MEGLDSILKILGALKDPTIITLSIVIFFLFRHINKLTDHLVENTSSVEKLVALVNVLCSRMKNGGL